MGKQELAPPGGLKFKFLLSTNLPSAEFTFDSEISIQAIRQLLLVTR